MTISEAPEGPLLEVRELSVDLRTAGGTLRAVDRVSFTLRRGDSLGVVGESGCGKSLTCLALMALLPPGARASGSVRLGYADLLDGADLLGLSEQRLEALRGRRIAMVFQDPHGALNPVRTVGSQLVEILVRHLGLGGAAARSEARRLLDRVQVPGAGRRLGEYPHQLSGGLCQRVTIAMAIACGPDLLIADEPTTALDVTVQAQILALLRDLQRDLGMALVIVTHDLGVVAQMAGQVMVMYAGRAIEHAPVRDLFARPLHPYTRALLGASPHRTGFGHRLVTIPGRVPMPGEAVGGCAFRRRCPEADARCASAVPPPVEFPDGRSVACFRAAAAPVA